LSLDVLTGLGDTLGLFTSFGSYFFYAILNYTPGASNHSIRSVTNCSAEKSWMDLSP